MKKIKELTPLQKFQIQERLNAKIRLANKLVMKMNMDIESAVTQSNVRIASVIKLEEETRLSLKHFKQSPLIDKDVLNIDGLKINNRYKIVSNFKDQDYVGRLVFINPNHIEIQTFDNQFIYFNPASCNFTKV